MLEKALDNLPPNDVADVLVHLRNGISDLSQKLSRRKANFLKLKPEIHPVFSCPTLHAAMLGSAGASTSMTNSAHAANEISDAESVYEEDALDEPESQIKNV